MKPRSRLIIAATALAMFAALFAWLLGLFEPRYAGLPAKVYLRGLIEQGRFGGKEDREKVLAVPARIGVPILIEFTKAQDPRWRGWYQRLYPHLPQFVARRLGPPKSSAGAINASIMALGYYGAEARDAVPQLLRIGGSQFLQTSAIETLGEIGPAASNAIPDLITNFQSRSPALAQPSAGALARIDVRGERSGALLAAALDDQTMRWSALGPLGSMARNDPKWVSEIWRAASNSLALAASASPNNPSFISGAFAKLSSLNAFDASRVQWICAHSTNDAAGVRQGVVMALEFAPAHAMTTVPVLDRLLRDTNAAVRNAACFALTRYVQNTNVESNLRLTVIRAVLSCGDDAQKWNALGAAQRLGPAALPLLGEFTSLLSNRNERLRGKAAETVGAFGPKAKAALPALQLLLKDEWESVRDAAAAALKSISAESPPK